MKKYICLLVLILMSLSACGAGAIHLKAVDPKGNPIEIDYAGSRDVPDEEIANDPKGK
jgi:hypothetical protein